MKHFALSLVVLGLALAAAPATAQDACKTSFMLEGTSPDNVWKIGGATNPTITACPGQEITLSAKSVSGVHNIAVDGVTGAPAASDVIDEGQSFDYKFTAPASGSGTYVCKLHSGTMKGTINFAATSAAPNGDGEEKESSGVQVLGVALAMLGAALIVGRRTK